MLAAAVAVRAHLARVRERVGTALHKQIPLTRCEPPLPLSKWQKEERLCNNKL